MIMKNFVLISFSVLYIYKYTFIGFINIPRRSLKASIYAGGFMQSLLHAYLPSCAPGVLIGTLRSETYEKERMHAQKFSAKRRSNDNRIKNKMDIWKLIKIELTE